MLAFWKHRWRVVPILRFQPVFWGSKTNSLPKLLKYHRFFKPIHFPKEWILHLLRFPKKGIPICGLNHLRGKNRLSNEKTLAVHGTYGITLASYTRWYVGIIISLLSHHKDPYEKTSIYTVMENQRVLFVAHFKRWGHPKTHPKNFKKKSLAPTNSPRWVQRTIPFHSRPICSGWWLQHIWKTVVKMRIFPKGVNILSNVWNHHRFFVWKAPATSVPPAPPKKKEPLKLQSL